MCAAHVVPRGEAVASMLGMLYGGDTPAESIDIDVEGSRVATFVDDAGEIVAACICDPSFVGFAGAALSMIPAGGAEDMIAEGSFSDTVLENFYEVMNVCSRLLMSDSSPHLKLDKVTGYDEAKASIEALASSAETVAFRVTFPKYGAGSMKFLVS